MSPTTGDTGRMENDPEPIDDGITHYNPNFNRTARALAVLLVILCLAGTCVIVITAIYRGG